MNLFHGTPVEFDTFEVSYSRHEYYGKGIYLSEEQVFLAVNKGFKFKKLIRKTPASSTTVIFAGDRGIELLNRLYKKDNGLVTRKGSEESARRLIFE